jgi:hypothetical protein
MVSFIVPDPDPLDPKVFGPPRYGGSVIICTDPARNR